MNNDMQAGAGTLSRKLPSNIGTAHRIHKNTWKIAFVFAFISLVIDGVDIMTVVIQLNQFKSRVRSNFISSRYAGKFITCRDGAWWNYRRMGM